MPRTLVVGAFASTLIAWSWLRLGDGAGSGRAVLVVALALLPALVPGTRRRAAVAALAAAGALEVAFGWSSPGQILSSFGRGFLDFYDVQVPFDAGVHLRMQSVLLVAVFAFTLWVVLASAARRPGLASVGLVVGVGWPGTLLPGHDLLRGALLLAGVLVAIVSLRREPLRGLGTALALGALVVVAAVGASSSPAFAKRAFLDWQSWDPYNHPTKPVERLLCLGLQVRRPDVSEEADDRPEDRGRFDAPVLAGDGAERGDRRALAGGRSCSAGVRALRAR